MLIALNVLSASQVWAARPLTTEDTGTLDPGKAEVELGLDYIDERDSQTFLLGGGPALNVGLLPRLEGAVATAVIALHPEDRPQRAGIGDSLVRLKYRLVDETVRVPAVMVAATARLPTGDADRGLGQQGVDIQALAVASKAFGPVTCTLNTGFTFVTRDRDLDRVHVGASAEVAATRTWTIVGEVVSDLPVDRRADDRVIVRVGTVHALGERVKLDAAAGFGTTRAGPDVLLTLGITMTLR